MIRVISKSFETKIAILLIAARITIQSSSLQALYWDKEKETLVSVDDKTREIIYNKRYLERQKGVSVLRITTIVKVLDLWGIKLQAIA